LKEIEEAFPKLISDCRFGDSPVTQITAPPISKASLEKAKKAMKKTDQDAAVENDGDETETESEES
jgi:hypothetical protein